MYAIRLVSAALSLALLLAGAAPAHHDREKQEAEKKAPAKGKMIFIGPDGKKREIDLGQFTEGHQGAFRLFALQGKADFMLGLDCEPAGDTLRAHLGLDKGVGLVVKSALEGTPANKAGVRAHDVLVSADKTQLASVADLVKAVQAAGKEGKSVQLALIRAGKKTTVEVKPTERKPVKFEVEGKKEAGKGPPPPGVYSWTLPRGKSFDYQFYPQPKNDQLEKRIDELTKKVQALEKAIQKLQSKDD